MKKKTGDVRVFWVTHNVRMSADYIYQECGRAPVYPQSSSARRHHHHHAQSPTRSRSSLWCHERTSLMALIHGTFTQVAPRELQQDGARWPRW
ncbi:hypothetical protein E2C01_001210 [Portunus trituberculatus]|uniref:Uncharacterized protein n=1 Tax=Portunus trituberculatus TaxID=210409 RepID=A0A5B7CIR4_PORTR|nr:hypothetical protein [Portunus trituberculatus]